MDRVLLVIDDIQFAGHLEMTLRKIGFDIETITNEYNLNEKLLTFNPNFIIVKGMTSRVSAISVGKKLKEAVKFHGKVVLVFPEEQKSSPDEFIKLRMDLLLFDPISSLKLVTHLLSLTTIDKDIAMDKLFRFASTDSQFRSYESQILKSTGGTLDSELKIISGESKQSSATEEEIILNEEDILNFVNPSVFPKVKQDDTDNSSGSSADKNINSDKVKGSNIVFDDQIHVDGYEVTEEYKNELKNEIAAVDHEMPLRIESYNRVIKTIDQDLKKGLKKRETRDINKKIFQDILEEESASQDAERRRFAKALLKK